MCTMNRTHSNKKPLIDWNLTFVLHRADAFSQTMIQLLCQLMIQRLIEGFFIGKGKTGDRSTR